MKQPHKLGRRGMLGGALAAGGAVAAASLLPAARVPQPEVPKLADADPAPPTTGYQETEHVKRYYATARI
jgi:hypothetical protein